MKYAVYENDRPAVLKGSYECWHNNVFDTMEQAIIYARQWLGIYEPNVNYNFTLNVPYHYQQDCHIVIKKLEV